MTPEMDLPTGRILSTTLHHIDIGGQVCERVAIPGEADDLEQYLSELLGEIGNKPQKREYALAAQTTEFARALRVFYEEPDLSMCDEAEGLAGRLLRIEITTDNKFGHLNPEGTGHVKKGSFLQFIYKDGNSIQYLGVKIEHQSFIDEEDFRRKIGLGETQKVYKACKVGFDRDGQVFDVLIFDTNSKPSTYWWRDFWELTELRTDEHNTKTAIKAVTKTLAPLKKVSRADYTLLRNASVAAFKKDGRMNFDEFVTEVFSTYSAETEQSEKKIKEITKKLRKLPERKNFDSQFDLKPGAVPFRQITVPVTSEINLQYTEGIANLEDKIWSSRTRDGKTVLLVDANEENARRFKFKPME